MLKGGEKMPRYVGTLVPKDPGSEPPGFSLCLTYDRLGAKKLPAQKHKWVQIKKSHSALAPESLLFLATGPEKGHPSKMGNILDNSCSTPNKYYGEKLVVPPTHTYANKGHILEDSFYMIFSK